MLSFLQFLNKIRLLFLKRKFSKLHTGKNEERLNIFNPQIYKPFSFNFQKLIKVFK